MRKLAFKSFFHKDKNNQKILGDHVWKSKKEFCTLKNLSLLFEGKGAVEWEDEEEQVDIESLLKETSGTGPLPPPLPPVADFKKKSTKVTLIQSMPLLSSFLKNITWDIDKLNIKSKKIFNLTNSQEKALKEFQSINLTLKAVNKWENIRRLYLGHWK